MVKIRKCVFSGQQRNINNRFYFHILELNAAPALSNTIIRSYFCTIIGIIIQT